MEHRIKKLEKGNKIKTIYDYTLKELQEQIKPSFRAKQIYDWIYKKYATSFDEMKNIPKDLKERLFDTYPIDICKIIRIEKSLDSLGP